MLLFKHFTLALVMAVAVSATQPAHADGNPKGFATHRFNGSVQPVTKDGITTFRILDKQCSSVDYGDGRGENDCRNGNVRSALVARGNAKIGSTVEYSMDIRIDPSFAYPGFYNDHSIGYLRDASDSRLRIASWEGPLVHNFLYMLKVDARHGVTFLGKQCQAPAQFGNWVSFSMRVNWTNNKSGWIDVKCNGEIVYSATNVATNQAPHCYITNQCEKGVAKNPKSFIFIVGPVMAGFGFEWKKYGKPSPFTEIQKDGIIVQMKNIKVKKIAKG